MRRRTAFGGALAALMLCACAAPSGERASPDHGDVASPARRGPSPISMTAEDGTPLQLRRLTVRAQLDELIAFTELDMVFANSEGRALAAALSLTLPAGARVTRFAIFQDGDWDEAEVVPRRDAYDALVSGEREPALASAASFGDRFVARDLRIRQGTTRLVVSYVEHLGGRERPYRVALAGLPRMDELDLRIYGRELVLPAGVGELRRLADGRQLFLRREEASAPAADLLVQSGIRSLGLRHENMFVARIRPVPHDHSDPLEDLTILFDTSASQALDFERNLARLAGLIAAIREESPTERRLRVLCFDQGVEAIFEGSAAEFDEAAIAAIRRRGALGASNLVEALRYVASRRAVGDRLVLMTDAVVTSGAGSVEALRAELGLLAKAGIRRIDAITMGGIHQPRLLQALTRGGALASEGLVLRGDLSAEVSARKLAREVHSGITITVPGSEWVFPSLVDSVQADDTVLVFAELGEELAAGPLQVLVEGPHAPPPIEISATRASSSSLLRDAWTAAYVGWMGEQVRSCDPATAELCAIWRRRISEWSTRHRILNGSTALAMLGRADDYRRFGLDEADPPSLLAFGGDRVEVYERARVAARGRAHALAPEPAIEPVSVSPLTSGRSEQVGAATENPAQPWASATEARRAPRPAAEPRPSWLAESKSGRRWPGEEQRQAAAAVKPELGPRWRPEEAYEGLYLAIMETLRRGVHAEALRLARDWRADEPADVRALLALGEAFEAIGRVDQAARAYGSILDLFPTRPEMQRLAGERLERLGSATRHLVLDSYGRAIRRQSGSPSAHRLLGYALLRASYYREAFDTLVAGFAWAAARAETRAIADVLYDDIGLAAAAWLRARPGDREFIMAALEVQGIALATTPSLRFVLSWDTALSDVDLHVRDGDGQPAFHGQPALTSGGKLYGDVKEGFGVEAFVIDGIAAAYPYNLKIFYPLAVDDPLGYGMGKLEIIEHDGAGRLRFDQRPFIVQRGDAKLDLGTLDGPLAAR
jgi:tetratricopeptide (TPR) repeat protein